jgi:hypothetical protein
MSQDTEAEVVVETEKIVTQTETVTIKTNRGSGTRNEDTVKKHVQREAQLAVSDTERLPDLIGEDELESAVDDVKATMTELREFDPDAE